MCEVIGFHNPDEKYGFLSNWYLSDFTTEGILFFFHGTVPQTILPDTNWKGYAIILYFS